jgi:hypothetical protein
MTGSPPPQRSRRDRILRLCVLGVVFSPILALLAWYAFFRLTNANAISRLEDRMRQRGEPMNLAQLAAKYPPIPDAENAAVGLLELWEKDDPAFWQAFLRGEKSLPQRAERTVAPALPFLGAESPKRLSRSEPLPPASRQAAEDFVKQQAEHMEAVRLALQRPRCIFPVKITDGYAALLPHLSEMKREAQTFRLLGTLAVERGDVDGAIAGLEDISRTGQSLSKSPFLIDQLVRVSCLAMPVDDAQRLLSQRVLTETQFARLEKLLQKSQAQEGLRLALLSERAAMVSVFDLPAKSLGQFAGEASGQEPAIAHAYRAGSGFLAFTGLADRDRRLILETMEQGIALADEDSPSALEQFESVYIKAAEKAQQFPQRIFSAMMLPSLTRVGTRFAAFESRRRAALAALAVERYRLEHQGRLPDNLAALVPKFLPQVPGDPFDGQPLRYHTLSKGYVIYSVGRDRHDDGGKERPEKGEAKDYDETFIVER